MSRERKGLPIDVAGDRAQNKPHLHFSQQMKMFHSIFLKNAETCRLFEAVDVFHEKSWTEVNLKFDRSAAKKQTTKQGH